MIAEKSLSLSSNFIQAVWTSDGELSKSDKKKLRFYRCLPLSSSLLELGFQGIESEGFYDRLKEAISRLPSNYEGQIVLDRKSYSNSEESTELFPKYGLYSNVYLIESALDAPGASSLKQLFDDLGMEPTPVARDEYLYLLNRMLGQNDKQNSLLVPDLTWEEEYIKIGKSYVKAASLTDLPLTTWNNCLQALYETADEFVCSLKIRVPDKNKTKKELETKRRVSHALSVRKAH